MTNDIERNRPNRQRCSWLCASAVCLSLCFIFLLAACSKPSTVGPIDDRASLAVLSFEDIDAQTSGVVYRTVRDFSAFIAQAKTPVLLVFHQPGDPINTQVIPRIEQLADNYQGRLTILWIDASTEVKLANDFQVYQTPQFTMMVDAAIKLSLIGYGEQAEQQLDQLIEAYVE